MTRETPREKERERATRREREEQKQTEKKETETKKPKPNREQTATENEKKTEGEGRKKNFSPLLETAATPPGAAVHEPRHRSPASKPLSPAPPGTLSPLHCFSFLLRLLRFRLLHAELFCMQGTGGELIPPVMFYFLGQTGSGPETCIWARRVLAQPGGLGRVRPRPSCFSRAEIGPVTFPGPIPAQ